MTELDSLALTYDSQGKAGQRFSLLSKDNLISSSTTSNCGRQNCDRQEEDDGLTLQQAAIQDHEYQDMEEAPDSNTGNSKYQDAIYDDNFCDHPQRILCSGENDNHHHANSAHANAGDCLPPPMERCKCIDVEDVSPDLLLEKGTSISTKMKSYNDESTNTTTATSNGASCDATTILTKEYSFDPSSAHFCLKFSEIYAQNLQTLIDCMDQSKISRNRVASIKMALKKSKAISSNISRSTITTITTNNNKNVRQGDFLQLSSNENRRVKLGSPTNSMIKEARRLDLISDDTYADDDDQYDEDEDHMHRQLKKRKMIEANHADPIKPTSSKDKGATAYRGLDVGMLLLVDPLLTFNEQCNQEEELCESRSIDVSSIGTKSALPSSVEAMMGMTHDTCPVCDVPKHITTICYHDSSIIGNISSTSISNTSRTIATSTGGGDLTSTATIPPATEEKSNSFGSSTSEDAIQAFKVDSSLTVFI